MKNVIRFIGRSQSLTAQLAASVEAAERYPGAIWLPKSRLPSDEKIAAVHAALEELMRPKGWVPTGLDALTEAEELLR